MADRVNILYVCVRAIMALLELTVTAVYLCDQTLIILSLLHPNSSLPLQTNIIDRKKFIIMENVHNRP